MWNRILIVTLSLSIVACATSGQPPKMERPIKLYNGAPEREGICRQENAAQEPECISAKAPEFKGYAGIPLDDVGVLQRFILNLVQSCVIWKK